VGVGVSAALDAAKDQGESSAAPARAEVWKNWRRLQFKRLRDDFFTRESFRSGAANPAPGFGEQKHNRLGTGEFAAWLY